MVELPAHRRSLLPVGRRRRLPRHLGQFRRPPPCGQSLSGCFSGPRILNERSLLMSPSARTALFIDGAICTRPPKRSVSTSTTGACSRNSRTVACYYGPSITRRLSRIRNIHPSAPWSIGSTINGYTVVTKPTKEFVDASGRRKVKGSMSIELAVNVMELADHIDAMVLFSGDGDYRPLLKAVQRRGVLRSPWSPLIGQPAADGG